MATQVGSLDTLQEGNFSNPSKGKSLNSQSSSISKVRVVIRVRPFLPQEISGKHGDPISCVSVVDSDSKSCDEVTVHLKDQQTR